MQESVAAEASSQTEADTGEGTEGSLMVGENREENTPSQESEETL